MVFYFSGGFVEQLSTVPYSKKPSKIFKSEKFSVNFLALF